MTLAYEAMMFAREVHKGQRRKYTGSPYFSHLAEVAGVMGAFDPLKSGEEGRQIVQAVCWLHDCVEDQGVTRGALVTYFGEPVAAGVLLLSDLEAGNRTIRKAAARERLSRAPGWVQSIKCADMISNTNSLAQHDPKFAKLYLDEKRLMLEVLTRADPDLRALANHNS